MAIFHTSHTEHSFDPTSRFQTSWLVSPALLFAIRALLATYCFVTISVALTLNSSTSDGQSFSYFTWLTYWGLAFYLAFSAAHTASYWLAGTSLLARWPRPLQIAHSMFYSTIVVFPFIVTIVYWSILYPDAPFDSKLQTWQNTSQHAINSVFAFIEVCVPRTAPLPFLHIITIVILLALYLGLAYLTYDTQHRFVYDFLDNKKHAPGIVAGYCIGILVGAIIIFLIVRYLILLRVWITEQKLGMTGRFTRRGVSLAGRDSEKGVRVQEISTK